LPLAFSDSTQGEITNFGLITGRLTDTHGQERLVYINTGAILMP
jgi:hypothetical protein